MPLLSGLRGRKAADVDALVDAVCRLGAFFAANRTLEVIELNPVIVAARGEGVRAVDVVTIAMENNADRKAGALQ